MDLYSTDVLVAVVQDLRLPPQFLVDRFFPTIREESSEEIHFDVDTKPRKLAPFVSPVVQGRIVEARGFATKSFKPAYVKPKTPILPGTALKRIAGERLGGALSPADRSRALVAQTLETHVEMIRRRMEWMAAEVLRTGAVTISGDGYQTVALDFGRAAALEVTLSGTDLWSDTANSDPLADLRSWATLTLKESGAFPRDVVMEADAYEAFAAHPKVTAKLDLRRGVNATVSLDAIDGEGGQFMGTIDGFNIFAYQAWYVNDAGTVTPFLPSGTVLMASQLVEGEQAFGAIQDHEVLQAMAFYPKSWLQDDPSVRYVMTQSAPLVVPYRVNATFAATVL